MATRTTMIPTKNVIRPNRAIFKKKAAAKPVTENAKIKEAENKNKELKEKLKEALAAADRAKRLEDDMTTSFIAYYSRDNAARKRGIQELKKIVKRAKAKHNAARKAHEKMKKQVAAKKKEIAELRQEINTAESRNAMKTLLDEKKKVAKLRKEWLAARRELRVCQEEKEGVKRPWKSCEICTLEYTKGAKQCPRVLECGHILCAKCIKTMINYDEIQCPFDRQVIQITKAEVDTLPMDLLILEN